MKSLYPRQHFTHYIFWGGGGGFRHARLKSNQLTVCTKDENTNIYNFDVLYNLKTLRHNI